MRPARRQHRATPQSRQATFNRGMAMAWSALYSTEPLTPERQAELLQALAATPYSKRQGDLELPEAAEQA